MRKIKILLADNDKDFLRTREQILEAEGYEVIPANGVEEAERMLTTSMADLAIVDLRLRDNNDEYDLSGLHIIKNTATQIPKILLTEFPSVEAARKALGDLPRAVDFLSKAEGTEVLLRAVKAAVKEHVLHEQETRRMKERTKRIRYAIMATLGVILFVGVLFLLREQGVAGIVIALVIGIASQGVVEVFFRFLSTGKTG
jgi:DNA-binding NtrC family response regulator